MLPSKRDYNFKSDDSNSRITKIIIIVGIILVLLLAYFTQHIGEYHVYRKVLDVYLELFLFDGYPIFGDQLNKRTIYSNQLYP